MFFRVNCLITDGRLILLENGCIPASDCSSEVPSLVDCAIKNVKRLLPGAAYTQVSCLSKVHPVTFLFLTTSFSSGTLGEGVSLSPLSELDISDDDRLEDVVFGYFRAVTGSPPSESVLIIDGKPSILTDDTLWESLAKAHRAKATGSLVEIRGQSYMAVFGTKKYERLDTYIPTLESVFGELKDKYYPATNDSPAFRIVNADSPFLARTAPEGSVIYIDVNEAIISDQSQLRQVLAHELIHWRLFREGLDVAAHGETFDMLASEINAEEGDNYVCAFADMMVWR